MHRYVGAKKIMKNFLVFSGKSVDRMYKPCYYVFKQEMDDGRTIDISRYSRKKQFFNKNQHLQKGGDSVVQ